MHHETDHETDAIWAEVERQRQAEWEQERRMMERESLEGYRMWDSGPCRVCGEQRIRYFGYCAHCLPSTYLKPKED